MVQGPILCDSLGSQKEWSSTLAVKTLALLDCAEVAVFLAQVLAEIVGKHKAHVRVKCFVDDKSLVEALRSSKGVEYRTENSYCSIERFDGKEGNSVSSWVGSSNQLAN